MSAATEAVPRMGLASISRGPVARPYRIVLYGLDGVGKSTFAAGAPNPVFLGAEDGTATLDVARFPRPENFQDILDAIRTLATESHDFQTLTIDTLDWVEPLIYKAVCEKANESSIEDIPYGAGYKQAAELWHKLLAHLERLQDRTSMHVIMLAHSHIRTFKNPQGEDFDRYELKLHAKSAGIIREWPDEVLFADYQVFTHTDKKKRVRGISDGSRVLHTTRAASFDAKNRHGLPDTIPLCWDDFEAAYKAGVPASASAIKSAIEALLPDADDELAEVIRKTVDKAGDDAAALAKILDRAKTKIEGDTGQ